MIKTNSSIEGKVNLTGDCLAFFDFARDYTEGLGEGMFYRVLNGNCPRVLRDQVDYVIRRCLLENISYSAVFSRENISGKISE